MGKITSATLVILFMISALSGCLGNETEPSDSIEESILYSRSGTVEHNYCKLLLGQGSSNNTSGGCPTDDETIADYWSAITNFTTINQRSGEGIKVHALSGGLIATTCSNGAIWGWDIHPDNGDTFNTASPSAMLELVPFAGQECVLTLHHREFSNSTVYWSITYEIVQVNTE
jgi:hypothetical protein